MKKEEKKSEDEEKPKPEKNKDVDFSIHVFYFTCYFLFFNFSSSKIISVSAVSGFENPHALWSLNAENQETHQENEKFMNLFCD